MASVVTASLRQGPWSLSPRPSQDPLGIPNISGQLFVSFSRKTGPGNLVVLLTKNMYLLFFCEIYYGKKWPNPRKEDCKQSNKNVNWRPCHSFRLHLPAEPCGFGAPTVPFLPVSVSCSLGSASPVSGVLRIPCSARDRHPQPWWAGRVAAKWACNSGMRAQSCKTAHLKHQWENPWLLRKSRAGMVQ